MSSDRRTFPRAFQLPFGPICVLALLLSAGCSNGILVGNADAVLDEIKEEMEDAREVLDGRDADLPDERRDEAGYDYGDPAWADCFHSTDITYDLSALGLERIEPETPPLSCGECCRQITFGGRGGLSPGEWLSDIWGNLLVYEEDEEAFLTSLRLIDLNTFDIYLLKRGEPGEWDYDYLGCAIYRNHVYYVKSRIICDYNVDASCCPPESPECFLTEQNIVHLDLLTGVEEELFPPYTFDGGRGQMGPAYLDSYDNILVWSHADEGYSMESFYKVYMFDLETNELSRLSDNEYCCAIEAEVWKNRIIWDQYDYSPGRVYLHDLSTGLTGPIFESPFDQWGSAIWESRVTYFDSRNGGNMYIPENSDVFMRDLETGDETVVCDEGSIQNKQVDIFENVVVWGDQRNDPSPNDPDETNLDVFARNLVTGEERNLTPSPGFVNDLMLTPRVWGHRVFFFMKTPPEKGWNIFMIDLKGIGFVE